MGTVIRALLITFTHIPRIWITPIWLFAMAVFGGLGMWGLGKFKGGEVAQPTQGSRSAELVKTVLDLSFADEFYNRQDRRLTDEFAGEITKALVDLRAEDRERKLIRLSVAALWGAFFSETWMAIYGSQIKALITLNKGGLPRNQMQSFYNHAAIGHPAAYANYSFDSWLAFLRKAVLILEKDGNVFITVRGQAFLTTMIQYGNAESDRPY